MESAKKTLILTKYFLALPSTRQLAAAIIFICIAGGALFAPAAQGDYSFWALAGGAASGLLVIAVPATISAGFLALLRRRVGWKRALAVALISCTIYISFYLAALAAKGLHAWGANLVFVGIGLSLVAWFSILRFAFGLERSAWIFSILQLFLHSIFLLAGSSIALGAYPESIAAKLVVTSVVFLAAMGGLLFLASAPLKKNLGLTSSDALSMFLSQWIYGEKDLEDAFAEIGEKAETLVGVSGVRTRHGTCLLVVPYLHFGPFGNLGGSQFSHQIATALRPDKSTSVIVFHGTATHDFDPVSTSELAHVVGACQKAISSFSYAPAKWAYSEGKDGDSLCHLLSVNGDAFASFTRAPLSTEDVNFSIGWALMQKAEAQGGCCIVADCHNSETGELDYVESGSPIAFEMMGALEKAISRNTLSEKMLAGWAESYPENLTAIGAGGVKAILLTSEMKKGRTKASALAYVVIDGNGISSFGRERLLSEMQKWGKSKGLEITSEIFTTDTHQLNNVRGVFNPVCAGGESDIVPLWGQISSLLDDAHSRLAPASFACAKERLSLKVLGPYQSAEIVSTLNSVVAILKIAMPLVLLISIGFLLWALSKL